MSEYINHPSYEIEAGGEVRADFHLAGEDIGTLEEGRRLVEARRKVELAEAQEVKITEKDIALSIGKGLLVARRWKAGTAGVDTEKPRTSQKDFDLAGGQ